MSHLSNPDSPSLESTTHMLREIYEQPDALTRALERHLAADGEIRFDRVSPQSADWYDCDRIVILASGASRHAGLCGKLMIESRCEIPVEVEFASEFCHRDAVRHPRTLAIVITQSGETGDTLAAMRVAKQAGYTVLAITNVEESTIARESHLVLYTHAGKEFAVPATKSFTTQLLVLHLFSLLLATRRNTLEKAHLRSEIQSVRAAIESLRTSLPDIDAASRIVAERYSSARDFVLLGRGLQFPIALEGALKLKETAYLNAEGFAAGEFRHGPAAVLTEQHVIVGLVPKCPEDAASVRRYDKTVQVLRELEKYTSRQIWITSSDLPESQQSFAEVIHVPPAPEALLPIVTTLPLQLMAFYIATQHGINVDAPRNLVKSVQED